MTSTDIQRLLDIMARLRDPEHGCPWDVQQDFATIAPYTIEEAYEVADAIDRGDMDDLRDELGDLLLQVVFHARMAEEADTFGFGDVVATISDKMVRRHPHVFGDEAVADAESQSVAWDEHKRREREAAGTQDTSALAGIPRGLPEWQRAVKLQKRAARTGFEWPHLVDEIGDVLFVAANLARHAGVDVGTALRRANAKFERRFRAMEALAQADGTALAALPLDAQDRYWKRVKESE